MSKLTRPSLQAKTRLYAPDSVDSENPVLGEDPARYLTRVLHARPGDTVILFGKGNTEAVCTIVEIGEEQVDLKKVETREVDRESPAQVSLAIATGKGKKLEEVVEAVTALGAVRVLPFVGRHSVARRQNPRLSTRLGDIAVSACRQSGRTVVPSVEPVAPCLEAVLEILEAIPLLVLDEAGGESPARAVAALPETGQRVALFVGPEGGWSEEERTLLREAGAVSVSLGPRILRTELAATVAVSLFESLLSARCDDS